MISFIKGVMAGSYDGGIIIENGGIGYEVGVPGTSALAAASVGQEVIAHTAMMVREDDISLYGFDDRDSLSMFYMLLAVSGVGAKAALALLSSFRPSEIRRAIVFNDPDVLVKAPGIGKKTAQRIIMELKDKVDAQDIGGSVAGSVITSVSSGQSGAGEAIEALVALGYSRSEATEAVAATGIEDGDTETYIKAALKGLSRMKL